MTRPTDALLAERELQLIEAVRPNAAEWRALALEADQHEGQARGEKARAALFAAAAEVGLQRARTSQAAGGLELDPRERLVLLEELAVADAGLAVSLGATWTAAAVLEAIAPPDLFTRWVAPVLADETGRASLAAAATEPDHGSETHSLTFHAELSTRLVVTPSGPVLRGTKWMMTNGGHASAYLVLARRDGTSERVSVLVPATAPGLSTTPVHKRGLRVSPHATLVLDDVAVSPEQLLPSPDASEEQRRAGAAFAIASEALSMAAVTVGAAQAALDEARAYAATRRQSGQLLADVPVLALRLLEAQGEVDVARGACWHGAALEGRGALSLEFATATRAAAVDAARGACAVATSVVGSMALEEAHLLSKLARDVEMLAVALATPDFWRSQVLALTPRGG